MQNTLTVYPDVYVSMWRNLVATCPMGAFPEQVQAYLTDMAEAGIVRIEGGGYVTRVSNAGRKTCLPADFANQLKEAA